MKKKIIAVLLSACIKKNIRMALDACCGAIKKNTSIVKTAILKSQV